ncbi:hypothetical protein ABW21_db0207720 [Orbilia brochopaga]|nr:hypothetical protein ABW21_db0207720 [Drechslerella brochopaga]
MRPLSTHSSLLLLVTLSIDAASASPALWTHLMHSVERWLPQSPLNSQPNIKSSEATPGSLVTEEDEADSEEQDEDAELSKRQCSNSGLDNSGCNNSGNGNSGDNNSGNYNCGNGNSGNYNSGDGSAGNGGSGACGSVVVGQSVAYVYPAPSTVVVQGVPVTQVVTVQAPQVYTTYVVYMQPAATTVIYQQPQTVAIAAAESYAPRGCAYWVALGYRCSPANGWREMRAQAVVGMAVASVFWGLLLMLW